MADDTIRITGLRGRGRHGVLPQERRDGQEFVVDVALTLDLRAAAKSDDLAETVDYGELALRLHEVIEGQPVALLETLAERLAAICLRPGVGQVVVTVHKPQAPLAVPFADVSVTVVRP